MRTGVTSRLSGPAPSLLPYLLQQPREPGEQRLSDAMKLFFLIMVQFQP